MFFVLYENETLRYETADAYEDETLRYGNWLQETKVYLFVIDLLFGILDSKGEATWSLRNRLVKWSAVIKQRITRISRKGRGGKVLLF